MMYKKDTFGEALDLALELLRERILKRYVSSTLYHQTYTGSGGEIRVYGSYNGDRIDVVKYKTTAISPAVRAHAL